MCAVLFLAPFLAFADQPAAPADPDGGLCLEENVVFSKSGMTLDILRPVNATGSLPAIVWIHGGGWGAGDKRRGVKNILPFAERGYVCVSVSYRLTDEAVFPAQIHDCKAAIRFLRAHAEKYGIDSGRIGVWGASAGGHLAALLGTSGGVAELEGDEGSPGFPSRVQAVCDWYGPVDLYSAAQQAPEDPRPAKLLGGEILDNRELAVLASPVSHASPDDPPFLIMHGTRDDVVPLQQSRLLKWALNRQGVPVKLSVVRGGGHGGDRFEVPDVRKKVLKFFDSHLKSAAH
ncbi:MAG: alpha/beta hydrolase fold domain-containing protein [Kiritimatiellia bacterium]